MRLLFVINPVSGGKKKADHATLIRNFFKDRTETIEICIFGGPASGQELKKSIRHWHPDRVVAVGGDGTVKAVAEQLLHTRIPMGIIPAGSANGMAAELSIPENFEQAMQIILDGKVQTIDAIRINENEICIHLGDLGLNALLVRNFEQGGIRGKLGYALSSFKTLWQRQSLQVQIRNAQVSLTRVAFMIVLANARRYGTGVSINPDGNLSDGLFEVVIIRRLSILELLKMIRRFKPFDPRKTEVIQADQVTILTKRKAHFQVDGEYLGKVKTVKAAIMAQCLLVLIPA
ncbi:diacylglycerol/lipid kinase family protein [Chitinophaga sancti]|uniref:Diacylglycerol kinase family protein n=1 Tax=Chitinophaga sancti TaxID=1004 RepID=A0A1K1RPX3_9BACT|nr:diacylglycerol kinase family protein [Chitinophaga sancti]WQD62513.1 diacylglycerol kinase family protein [Chitinophaga sancti]WQG91918.1 diacylglycerol kinase family protein [Chitinophaga sancti]SFW74208.1 lipid kinase, YegS/Rv2252/BmrU family [Chitinophaga sancti]